ncbi:formyl transferase domain protein [Pseudopedobacter saltans DSM 12145]|uniref:Formyl transferase domain protein n=1 Tax=Pseudopedobacter saltans (strain ATCC 51119 / DSM 12145 / JCM 21818 / CCUG 39354 / LMG 10337 / NBRC 100064 / NCIMB 13643) TaxID=762903 RepID=F0SE38_PSESL|nr:formyltransferase family protein [Pseudopedobacter saltans]ADY52964.1 formyl transferase domain protein [Pseudopedobacter saltans DSM 12145]
MKIIVFANHLAVLPALGHFQKNDWLQAVISTDKLQGHNVQIKDYCSRASISFYQVSRKQLHEDLVLTLNNLQPDLAIMFVFSYRIPEKIFNIPKQGFYNVHFSLLPAYKGPDPVFWQIKNGETMGGISIHKVNEDFDEGEIVMQQQIPFIPGENWGICNNRYAMAVQNMLIQFTQELYSGNNLPELQAQQNSTYYKRPEKQDLTINWEQMSAGEIENLINAANPCYGGAITYLNHQPISILEVTPATLSSTADYKPGMIVHSQPDSGIFVACKQNEYLRINVVQTTDGILSGFKLAALGVQAGQSFETVNIPEPNLT